MALTTDYRNIENYQELYVEAGVDDAGEQLYKLDPTYEAIVFYTMIIGIGEITDATEAEFYARVAIMERYRGAVVSRIGEDGKREDLPITPADVRRMKGLRTNVFPMLTRTKFLKRFLDDLNGFKREYTEALRPATV